MAGGLVRGNRQPLSSDLLCAYWWYAARSLSSCKQERRVGRLLQEKTSPRQCGQISIFQFLPCIIATVGEWRRRLPPAFARQLQEIHNNPSVVESKVDRR
ncbi:unnamed protein product [Ectocarpus sp. 12 AP-2014]